MSVHFMPVTFRRAAFVSDHRIAKARTLSIDPAILETAGQDVSGFRRLRLVFFAACFEATDAPVAAGLTAGGGSSPCPASNRVEMYGRPPEWPAARPFSFSVGDGRSGSPAPRRQCPAMGPQTDVASFSLKKAMVRPQASSAASLL